MHNFTEYQKELFNDKSRFKIVVKGRQIGVSTLFAYKALVDCVLNNRDQIIVSASQRQSNHIASMIDRYLDTFLSYINDKGLNIKAEINTRSEKRFSNGKFIMTMPCSPNTIRGFSGDVWIDEYALHRYDKEIYTALTPIVTRGYNITITSTPLGQNNMFHKIYTDIQQYPNYKRYNIDIYTAKQKGFEVDIDLLKQSMTEDAFRQEYCCEFIDEATAYFPFSLIKKCTTDINVNEVVGDNYIGIDIGRVQDRSEIITVCKSNDVIYVKDIQTMQNVGFDEQEYTIKGIIERFDPIAVYGDSTGLGRQMMETLADYDGRVKAIHMTNNIKVDMFTTLKMHMEKNTVRFENDETLIRQLHSIRKTTTQANNVQFAGERDNTGHYDRVIALGMALLAEKDGGNIPSIYVI